MQRPRWEAGTWRWREASSKAGLKVWTLLRPVLQPPASPWDPKSQAFGGFLLDKHCRGSQRSGGCAAEGEIQATVQASLHAQGLRLGRTLHF